MFALHRFESASITDAKARRPKGFDLGSFVRDGWAHYGTGKAIRLEVLFSAAAAEHLAETPLSEDQRIGPEIDGRIRLRATVPDTPQLRWWLLGSGTPSRWWRRWRCDSGSPRRRRRWRGCTRRSGPGPGSLWR
jgi:hypothetical protein